MRGSAASRVTAPVPQASRSLYMWDGQRSRRDTRGEAGIGGQAPDPQYTVLGRVEESPRLLGRAKGQ